MTGCSQTGCLCSASCPLRPMCPNYPMTPYPLARTSGFFPTVCLGVNSSGFASTKTGYPQAGSSCAHLTICLGVGSSGFPSTKTIFFLCLVLLLVPLRPPLVPVLLPLCRAMLPLWWTWWASRPLRLASPATRPSSV